MKTTLYIAMLLLVLTGCTDALTGPELEPHRMESSDESTMADLSLWFDFEASPTDKDSIITYLTVYNTGPDAATGIRLSFESNTDCRFEVEDSDGLGGGDIILVDIVGSAAADADSSSLGGGGDFILVDIVGASAADADRPTLGGGDIILIDLVGASATGTGKTLAAVCLASGLDAIEFNAEVLASDARDPDSTPGNGDPDEDDQTSLRLYPEVPPCPDCPAWMVDDKG